jgi:hypothetical protein
MCQMAVRIARPNVTMAWSLRGDAPILRAEIRFALSANRHGGGAEGAKRIVEQWTHLSKCRLRPGQRAARSSGGKERQVCGSCTSRDGAKLLI